MLASRLPANTLQGMMDLCCQALCDDGDTFYSQRVFDLFPQMATATSGTWAHTSDSGVIFGGEVRSTTTNNNEYIEWNVYCSAGSYKLSAAYLRNTSAAKADININGGAVVDTQDQYGTLLQTTWTSAAFALTEGLNVIRFTKNDKNASSGSYLLNFQHVQLVKQDTGSALASVANVPHTIQIPIMFADSHTNWNTLYNQTTLPFGSMRSSTAAQNDSITYSFWAPKGAATVAVLYQRGTNNGIMSVTVDGASWGTDDLYGSALDGALSTGVSGTITSTGMHTITFTMATKHASSTGYLARFYHIQIRMTSITEPLTQDLAPEVALLWPVFAEAHTNWSTLTVASSSAYYNYKASSAAQNAEITLSSNLVLRPGTYRLDLLAVKSSGSGIHHVLIDSVDLGTVDSYNGSTTYNNVLTVASLVLAGVSPHTIAIKMATKNASSSNYAGYLTIARLIRTGA